MELYVVSFDVRFDRPKLTLDLETVPAPDFFLAGPVMFGCRLLGRPRERVRAVGQLARLEARVGVRLMGVLLGAG